MPRKKTVTRSDIIEAGFMQLLVKGPKGFSSRKIAEKLKCSTQPIYLEFKNMEELHLEVLDQFEELVNLIDSKEVEHTDSLIAAALKLLIFAQTDEKMFRALFLMGEKNKEAVREFSRKVLLNRLDESQRYNEIDDTTKERLYLSTLVVVMGLSIMKVDPLDKPSYEWIVSLLEAQVTKNLSDDCQYK